MVNQSVHTPEKIIKRQTVVECNNVTESDSDSSNSETCDSLSFVSLEEENKALRRQLEIMRTRYTALRKNQKSKNTIELSCPTGEQDFSGLHKKPSPERESWPEVATSEENDEEMALIALSNEKENRETFLGQVKDRAGWLVGLLCLQSLSSFIISRNEALLQEHIIIVQFLTMLVGAGGNAGNQASVRVIRGLAVGSIGSSSRDVRSYLRQEFLVGFTLMCIIGLSGCARAALFMVPLPETIAITASLCMIVMISIVAGATLPLCMKAIGIDPMHSATTIQVMMDILGVTITCREYS